MVSRKGRVSWDWSVAVVIFLGLGLVSAFYYLPALMGLRGWSPSWGVEPSLGGVGLEHVPSEWYSCPDCSVLLITIDSLRADHVGYQGYKFDTTPFIDGLAGESTVFTQAITSSPLTLPSHTSILTSMYPFKHGVRDDGRYSAKKSLVTLPEILKKKGFATGAFVSTFFLDSRFGLDQGFDVYDDKLTYPKRGVWKRKWFNHTNIRRFERKATGVSNTALKWMKENKGKQSFVWLHYFDPHKSYNAPNKYNKLFNTSKTKAYDQEIRYVDDQIKRVITYLNKSGALENTIIVIVADHGEAFGEHKEKGHGTKLYDTTLRVPLLVYHPKNTRPAKFKGMVETIDITPTILQILDVETPEEMQGRNLYKIIDDGGKDLAYSETFMPQRRKNESYLMSIRTKDRKYIYNNLGKDELYNIKKNPKETKNLIKKENTTAYKTMLNNLIKTNNPAQPEPTI